MNIDKLKKLTSKSTMTARKLNKKQESFEIKNNMEISYKNELFKDKKDLEMEIKEPEQIKNNIENVDTNEPDEDISMKQFMIEYMKEKKTEQEKLKRQKICAKNRINSLNTSIYNNNIEIIRLQELNTKIVNYIARVGDYIPGYSFIPSRAVYDQKIKEDCADQYAAYMFATNSNIRVDIIKQKIILLNTDTRECRREITQLTLKYLM